jgi:two-component system, NtrC family, sensor kinase
VAIAPIEKTSVSVSSRIVAFFVVMLISFAAALLFASFSLHRASEEMDELGKGMVPIALRVAQLRAIQETVGTMVDGLSEERSAGSTKLILRTLLAERSVLFGELQNVLAERYEHASRTSLIAKALREEMNEAEEALQEDSSDLDALVLSLSASDRETSQRVLEHFSQVETEGKRKLRISSDKIAAVIGSMSDDARMREQRALYLVIGTTCLSLLLGALLTLRARKMLVPLGALRKRARDVAQGDLTQKKVYPADDELGELQQSFEHMVFAVSKAREQAVSNERFAAIGKMAAHVTHEVRNPLTSIGLNLEMLEEDLPEGQTESRSLVSAIRSEVERLERISEDYLRVARLPSPRLEADDIAASVRQIIDFERRDMDRAGCVVSLDISESPPAAQFDEAQIRQSLLNLLRNARESMPQGGTIDVRVFSEGLSGFITVADRGPGITEDTRAHMFDPFFSTKGEGTGLGLAITRQIVEAHGGKVTHAHRAGGGSIFAISLPLTASNRGLVDV